MSDKEKGIYAKYQVTRTDGSSKGGRKHSGCAYYVLDLSHDPYAIPALRAYADACREEYPALAADLDKITANPLPSLEANHLMGTKPRTQGRDD